MSAVQEAFAVKEKIRQKNNEKTIQRHCHIKIKIKFLIKDKKTRIVFNQNTIFFTFELYWIKLLS